MFKRIGEAIGLLVKHFWLFTAIIFTVWLPGNILCNVVNYYVTHQDLALSLKLPMWIEGIFGPIYIGAMVFALFEIKSGRPVTYRQAMAVGFQKWGSLFAARFVAGFFMLLGLLALVIPGLVLAVRYNFLDEAVIIEGKGTTASRLRSIELTSGWRWQIFGSACLLFVAFIILNSAVYVPVGLFDVLDCAPVGIILDCLVDIPYAVIQIVMFLFYWDAVQKRQREADAEAANRANVPPLPFAVENT